MCLNVPFIILGPEAYDFISTVFLILYTMRHQTFYILCFFKYISIGKGFEVISSQKTKTVGIIREILKKPASEIIYRKYAIKTTISGKILRIPRRRATSIDSFFVEN